MLYSSLKHLHLFCVVLSFSFFILRAFWQFSDSPLLNKRAIKILPHIVDTLLLLSGLSLVILLNYYTTFPTWLIIKLILVVAYIISGIIAFRSSSFKLALPLSIALFFTIAYLAINKSAAL